MALGRQAAWRPGASHDDQFLSFDLNIQCVKLGLRTILEDRKLETFKGVKGNTLTMFVEKYPEKKAYFELSNETMKCAFPEPGPLEGVNSRSKTDLRMTSVDFQYTTKDSPRLWT